MIASNPTMKTSVGSRNARGVSDTSQVENRDHRQDAQADGHRGADQARERGGQRCNARTDRDGDCQRVVHDETRPRDQARTGTQVGARDGVGTASTRVCVDDLAIREHQDREQSQDHDGDRQDQVQSS